MDIACPINASANIIFSGTIVNESDNSSIENVSSPKKLKEISDYTNDEFEAIFSELEDCSESNTTFWSHILLIVTDI